MRRMVWIRPAIFTSGLPANSSAVFSEYSRRIFGIVCVKSKRCPWARNPSASISAVRFRRCSNKSSSRDIELAAHNHFTQMIAREEKLYRLKILEQLFQAPVVKKLRRPPPSSLHQHNVVMIGNPVRISRDRFDLFFRMKKRQYAGSRPQHPMQPFHYDLQQRRR